MSDDDIRCIEIQGHPDDVRIAIDVCLAGGWEIASVMEGSTGFLASPARNEYVLTKREMGMSDYGRYLDHRAKLLGIPDDYDPESEASDIRCYFKSMQSTKSIDGNLIFQAVERCSFVKGDGDE